MTLSLLASPLIVCRSHLLSTVPSLGTRSCGDAELARATSDKNYVYKTEEETTCKRAGQVLQGH